MSLESWPSEVLSHYPALLRGSLAFLGNHGGFSGANLWRLDAAGDSYCLKAWSADWRSSGDLAWIHALMARASVLPWMPRVLPTSDGATLVTHQDRLWELVTWMPGAAEMNQTPCAARLESAFSALAQLHQSWESDMANGVCPGIVRRLESWRNWQHLMQRGWRPAWRIGDLYSSIAEQLWQRVAICADEVPRRLTPWLTRIVPLQPCVCDLWRDHVLFTGDAVTGVIDFGSVKVDHIAVDLARLLGSMLGDNAALRDLAFAAYSRNRPLAIEDRTLSQDLDRTGTIIAVTHWLRWLYHERRRFDRPEAVIGRLSALLGRLHEPQISS